MVNIDDLIRKLEQLNKDNSEIGAYSEYGEVMKELLMLSKHGTFDDKTTTKLETILSKSKERPSVVKHRGSFMLKYSELGENGAAYGRSFEVTSEDGETHHFTPNHQGHYSGELQVGTYVVKTPTVPARSQTLKVTGNKKRYSEVNFDSLNERERLEILAEKSKRRDRHEEYGTLYVVASERNPGILSMTNQRNEEYALNFPEDRRVDLPTGEYLVKNERGSELTSGIRILKDKETKLSLHKSGGVSTSIIH
jgi:hypothetical protein